MYTMLSLNASRALVTVCEGASAPVVCARPDATPADMSMDAVETTVLVLGEVGVVEVRVELDVGVGVDEVVV